MYSVWIGRFGRICGCREASLGMQDADRAQNTIVEKIYVVSLLES